jgi:hypothetical protein
MPYLRLSAGSSGFSGSDVCGTEDCGYISVGRDGKTRLGRGKQSPYPSSVVTYVVALRSTERFYIGRQ